MQHNDRVTRLSNGHKGTVVGIPVGDMAYVRWDEGGGCNVATWDLAPEDKSWPPSGMETKTPDVETK